MPLLGEAGVDAVVDRIAAGNVELLRQCSHLGPRIVDAAGLLLADGPPAFAFAAAAVLAANVDALSPEVAFASYLQAFDRCVVQMRSRDDLHVRLWPRLATPPLRAIVAARWADGSLRTWIDARTTPGTTTEWHARHLIALLAVVPDFDDVQTPIARAIDAHDLRTVLEPLATIAVDRLAAMIRANPRVRYWCESRAWGVASGNIVWDRERGDRPRDFALVVAVGGDAATYEHLIANLETEVRYGREMFVSEWRALAAFVRDAPSRFPRAFAAAIGNQLGAGGPGIPAPRHALRILGELDPPTAIATLDGRRTEILASKNAYGFIELLRSLGATATLEAWRSLTTDPITTRYLTDALA